LHLGKGNGYIEYNDTYTGRIAKRGNFVTGWQNVSLGVTDKTIPVISVIDLFQKK